LHVSNAKSSIDSPVNVRRANCTAHKTLLMLDELLTQPHFDCVICTKVRVANPPTCSLFHLRPLFDTHYAGTSWPSFDGLSIGIRALGRRQSVLAGSFHKAIPPHTQLRGHQLVRDLLCDLLDAHEMVDAAPHAGRPWSTNRSSAVQERRSRAGVLPTTKQGCSVRETIVEAMIGPGEQISNLHRRRRDAYE